jgi:hypothetical protein
MKTLRECFLNLEKHPLTMIQNSFAKVKKKSCDLQYCLDFIDSISHLDFHERQLKINRMFMDKELPKNWKNMQELVQMAQSTKGKE